MILLFICLLWFLNLKINISIIDDTHYFRYDELLKEHIQFRILETTFLLKYHQVNVNSKSSVSWDDMSTRYKLLNSSQVYLPIINNWKYVENSVIKYDGKYLIMQRNNIYKKCISMNVLFKHSEL